MGDHDKPLAWLHGEVKTPPVSQEARIDAGEILGLPHSRQMPSIGAHCHELRIRDSDKNWRIIYRIDDDVILILEVFQKTTQKTPTNIIDNCQKRLKKYDAL
jgi:phage-related protein